MTENQEARPFNWVIIAALGALAIAMIVSHAHARDNGQYAQADPELRHWFNGLKSRNNVPCCSTSDGRRIEDADWERVSDHYRVRIDGEWFDVPPEAVITGPNRIGVAVVWPVKYPDGHTLIRCFLSGLEG